jgi:hypothetical protein
LTERVLNSDEKKRIAVGICAIVAASCLMPFADDTTPLIPIPVHNFAAYLFVSWGYLLLLPAIFALTYWQFGGRDHARVLVLSIALLIAALDAYWIFEYWALGLEHPRRAFVHAVALENAVAFVVVIGLAAAGVMRRSNVIAGYAYTAIFMALGWCAFPVLGRVGS